MKPREPRHKVLIQARMRVDGAWSDVCIRDISSKGLLVQAATPPFRGTYVEIRWGSQVVVCRVVWAKDRRFGVHTRERLDVIGILAEGTVRRSPPATAARATVERRSPARTTSAADVARQAERSRRMSAAMEFGCIALCCGVAAMIMASAVRETLARPLQTVSRHLLAE